MRVESSVEELAPQPERRAGALLWRAREAGVALCFVGRGAPARDAATALLPAGIAPAWLHQVHGARVVTARPGACGEGDALVVDRPGVAATVAVADCVPVLLAGAGRAAAVHAGWRGIAGGVVAAALAEIGGAAVAGVGPAIGPCCYEVGEEVARAVAAASQPSVRRPGRGDRPHLDLAAAVACQLAAGGVGRVRVLRHCTRCRPEWLESHRRDGLQAGRNLAWIWLEGEAG